MAVCAIDTRTLTRFSSACGRFRVADPPGAAIGSLRGRLAPAPAVDVCVRWGGSGSHSVIIPAIRPAGKGVLIWVIRPKPDNELDLFELEVEALNRHSGRYYFPRLRIAMLKVSVCYSAQHIRKL